MSEHLKNTLIAIDANKLQSYHDKMKGLKMSPQRWKLIVDIEELLGYGGLTYYIPFPMYKDIKFWSRDL